MPRSGGESDKLGNRYEGIWTVAQLLDLAAGKFEAITIEPFGDDSLGIEFIVTHGDGTRGFHSAKRQRAKGEWSLNALAQTDKSTGRSILRDLCTKVTPAGTEHCVFVSSTGANDLRELAERAIIRSTFDEFQTDLRNTASDHLRQSFEKYFVPISSTWESSYARLRHMRVVLIDEVTLKKQVDQAASLLVYRPNSPAISEGEVRILLGDFILDNLGSELRRDQIWAFLSKFGLAHRDWAADKTIHDVVRAHNQAYRRTVELELVNGTRILRTEAEAIVERLRQSAGAKSILVTAQAGVGKSCVLAQAIDELDSQRVPALVVRMDRHGDANSTRDIGRQMDLPQSPAVVLAGIANGSKAVLFVDQLDAVSQVSGRYPHLWEVFDSLCSEVDAYPNLRLVVACREFDLQHDHRLRKLRPKISADQIQVAKLTLEQVDALLKNADCSHKFAARQMEILQTPLHLYLLLESLNEERTVGFVTVKDLFDLYWERKQRAVLMRLATKNSNWISVVDKLCETMNRDFVLYAPKLILDEWPETVAAMLTEHVIVLDGNQVRFFHESFFDYSFARRFCFSGQRLIQLLHSGEQLLFRRSQVRQILAFLRDHSFDDYLTELNAILGDTGVRFHIKRLVISWLGTSTNPTSQEWDILAKIISDSNLAGHARFAIRNNIAWFDVLHSLGVWEQFLNSSDDAIVNYAIWFLTFEQVQKSRSDVAAKLLAPFRQRSPMWANRLRFYFRSGNAHQSIAIQDLFFLMLDDGVFEEDRFTSFWDCLYAAREEAPQFALAGIVRWMNRIALIASESPSEMRHEFASRDLTPFNLIRDIARRDPVAYVDEILPQVLRITATLIAPSNESLVVDRIWRSPKNSSSRSVSDLLLDELETALIRLAVERPDYVEALTQSLMSTESKTITCLLMRTWSANPTRFGSQCIRFLTSNDLRLDVGYVAWSGGGNGHATISREAIKACVPHAKEAERDQLEIAILKRLTFEEEGESKGFTERLLLEAFGEQYLSKTGRVHLEFLRAKFSYQNTAMPPRRLPDLPQVVNAIVPDAISQFSNDEWLSALREHQHESGAESPTEVRDHPRYSRADLSRVLQVQARLNRGRFAALALRMDDSIRSEFFESILNGICGQENMSAELQKKDDDDFRTVDLEVILGVIRRAHQVSGRPCGQSIGTAFGRIADRTISDSDLQILCYYAVEDNSQIFYCQIDENNDYYLEPACDPYYYGASSIRGNAARSIARLLFANSSRAAVLLPVIRQMVQDDSFPVRTCVVEALLPLLIHDRDEAVCLFLDACHGNEIYFGSDPIEKFIRYASSTHYASLRDAISAALNSKSPSAIAAAARQICLAAFTDEQAEVDVLKVHTGTEVMRLAAADVYSHNIGNATVGPICREHLSRLFADESQKVRAKAADCFRYLDDADFNQYTEIIRTYIDSTAFPSPHDDLLRRLEKSTWQLPDIIIRLAERFVGAYGSAAGDITTAAAGDAPAVSKLVIRLYAQTRDDAIQSKCLDLIDEMERFGFLGIDSELAEYDR